jgi:hypothetical protein
LKSENATLIESALDELESVFTKLIKKNEEDEKNIESINSLSNSQISNPRGRSFSRSPGLSPHNTKGMLFLPYLTLHILLETLTSLANSLAYYRNRILNAITLFQSLLSPTELSRVFTAVLGQLLPLLNNKIVEQILQKWTNQFTNKQISTHATEILQRLCDSNSPNQQKLISDLLQWFRNLFIQKNNISIDDFDPIICDTLNALQFDNSNSSQCHALLKFIFNKFGNDTAREFVEIKIIQSNYLYNVFVKWYQAYLAQESQSQTSPPLEEQKIKEKQTEEEKGEDEFNGSNLSNMIEKMAHFSSSAHSRHFSFDSNNQELIKSSQNKENQENEIIIPKIELKNLNKGDCETEINISKEKENQRKNCENENDEWQKILGEREDTAEEEEEVGNITLKSSVLEDNLLDSMKSTDSPQFKKNQIQVGESSYCNSTQSKVWIEKYKREVNFPTPLESLALTNLFLEEKTRKNSTRT